MLKSIGINIVAEYRIKEVLFDSTLKTNKNKLELFAVFVSCFGTGFPLAYFSLEAGTDGGNNSKKESISFFLEKVKERCQLLNPSFVLTDKEVSQINAMI